MGRDVVAELESKAYEKLTALGATLFNAVGEGCSGLLMVRLLLVLYADKTGLLDLWGLSLDKGLDGVYNSLSGMEASSVFPKAFARLFAESIPLPVFDFKAKHLFQECRDIPWLKVNPSIFGGVFQSGLSEEKRRSFGIHYTSEENIMKVIRPLFLDDLEEEFNKAFAVGDNEALNMLAKRMSSLNFLDPACGTGNFLIGSYRELRRIEVQCKKMTGIEQSKISIDHFHGIELLDFPAMVAGIAMHIAQRIADIEGGWTLDGKLPFRGEPHIVQGNALQIDWNGIVPYDSLDYVLGNPPFKGKKEQTPEEKADLVRAFSNAKGVRVLDYSAAWLSLASQAMMWNRKLKAAFVTTNSICQGEQVSKVWDPILERGQDIFFAYQSFKWTVYDCRAAVHCVIVGFCSKEQIKKRKLFKNGGEERKKPDEISPYLSSGRMQTVQPASSPVGKKKRMQIGCHPYDNGFLLLNESEFRSLDESVKPYAVPYVTSSDILHSVKRWCLWLNDAPENVLQNEFVQDRIDKCRAFRQHSARASTRKLAECPHLLGDGVKTEKGSLTLAVPQVTSGNRICIPCILAEGEAVFGEPIILNASLTEFAIISSAMHIAWMRNAGGQYGGSLQYSINLGWNTFPLSEMNADERMHLESLAQDILDTRKKHSSMCLAEMYNVKTMPKDLLEAHRRLDRAVDNAYGLNAPTDDERLDVLFKMYSRLVHKEDVQTISPYLEKSSEIIVKPSSTALSASKSINNGNMPRDGGALLLDDNEVRQFKDMEPRAVPFIRKFISAKTLLHNLHNWCLWLVDAPREVLNLPLVAERIEACNQFRLKSNAKSTRDMATTPHLFAQRTQLIGVNSIVIPRHMSDRRCYIPFEYVEDDSIVGDSCSIIAKASLYDIGIVASAMHMCWVKTIGGRLKHDYRYSKDLCWNTFPWPDASGDQKNAIEDATQNVLETRKKHPEMCLAEMYNPDTMPDDLLQAHKKLDRAVDNAYGLNAPRDDERLDVLFSKYKPLVQKQNSRSGVKNNLSIDAFC